MVCSVVVDGSEDSDYSLDVSDDAEDYGVDVDGHGDSWNNWEHVIIILKRINQWLNFTSDRYGDIFFSHVGSPLPLAVW